MIDIKNQIRDKIVLEKEQDFEVWMQNFVQQKSEEIKELIKAEATRLWRKD